MGLFTRRAAQAATAEAIWVPAYEGFAILLGGDADMADPRQERLAAYQTGFCLAGAPCAQVTVWTYAIRQDGRYAVALRYQYRTSAVPRWVYTGHEADPWREVYDRYSLADGNARDMAAALASGSDNPVIDFPSIFDWNGEFFPLAAQDRGWEPA